MLKGALIIFAAWIVTIAVGVGFAVVMIEDPACDRPAQVEHIPVTGNCVVVHKGQDSGSCILSGHYTKLSANEIEVHRDVKVLAF